MFGLWLQKSDENIKKDLNVFYMANMCFTDQKNFLKSKTN